MTIIALPFVSRPRWGYSFTRMGTAGEFIAPFLENVLATKSYKQASDFERPTGLTPNRDASERQRCTDCGNCMPWIAKRKSYRCRSCTYEKANRVYRSNASRRALVSPWSAN